MRPLAGALSALLGLCVLLARTAGAAEPAAQLALPAFEALRAQASESVAITLDEPLLEMAGRFLDSNKQDQAAARSMVSQLKGIYVLSFTFKHPYVYPAAEMQRLRGQLGAPPWQRLIQTHSEAEHSDAEVYVARQGEHPLGMAIIATDPLAFTVINILGPIDLAQLHRLEGNFGIPRLPGVAAPPAAH